MDATTHTIMVSYISPPVWYQEAFRIVNYVICVLQFFGLAINFVHFSILTRKEIRANMIYRLMLGICCCDLLTHINTFLIFSPFWIRHTTADDECLMSNTFIDALLYLHGITFLDITQRGASWMAVFMAFYRTLSIMFPMNPRISKLLRPVSALWTILAILIFTSLTTWMVQANKIIEEYEWDYDCDGNHIRLNETRYGVLVPTELAPTQSKLVSTYGLIKALPSLIDPILTVFLIVELRKAAKRRRNVGKSIDSKNENTTKLIVIVTISFIFLEVPNGFSHIINGFSYNNIQLRTISVMIPAFAEILPVLNTSSHFFICMLMSTEYRQAAHKLFCGWRPRKETTILVNDYTKNQ